MNTSTRPVRVRFAPSPTGALHIGGIRTALYNYLFAKRHKGTFILRIEDTDQTRFVEGAENYIVEALKWCGVPATEGIGFGDGEFAPYRQSDRMPIYRQYAEQLVASGWAYYAFDTNEDLTALRKEAEDNKTVFSYNSKTRLSLNNSLTLSKEEVKARLQSGEPYIIRFKIPAEGSVVFTDTVRKEVTFQCEQLDDKVLLKSDGMPTYHLANVVDDYLMQISHVIRGDEWLSSAPLHVLLYRAFGWEEVMPIFAHLPLILRPEGGGKLSKRDGDRLGFPVFPLDFINPTTGQKEASGYREKGFLPQAITNFMALNGWTPANNQEILSMDEMAEEFSLEHIHHTGAKFDYQKALWFNQQYIMAMPNEDLARAALPFIAQKGHNTSFNYVVKVVNLLKERVHLLSEFNTVGYYFFEPVTAYDPSLSKKWKVENLPFFEEIGQFLTSTTDFTAAPMEAFVKALIAERGMKMGEILPVLRIAFTGTMQGPGVFETAEVLGKNETTKRLRDALTYCQTL